MNRTKHQLTENGWMDWKTLRKQYFLKQYSLLAHKHLCTRGGIESDRSFFCSTHASPACRGHAASSLGLQKRPAGSRSLGLTKHSLGGGWAGHRHLIWWADAVLKVIVVRSNPLQAVALGGDSDCVSSGWLKNEEGAHKNRVYLWLAALHGLSTLWLSTPSQVLYSSLWTCQTQHSSWTSSSETLTLCCNCRSAICQQLVSRTVRLWRVHPQRWKVMKHIYSSTCGAWAFPFSAIL